MEFPKWKYHPKKDAVLVNDAVAEKELGAGWFDNPECKAPVVPVAAPAAPKPPVPVVEPKKES